MQAALLTAEDRIAKRPPGRVLIDYNQNERGRTQASVDSVRPHPRACVSTPVTWDEVVRGVRLEDLHIGNVPGLVRARRPLGSAGHREEAGAPPVRVETREGGEVG
jgi:DNA primase